MDLESFGIPEIGAIIFFFTGLFIYTVFSSFAKADPVAKGNPFLKESEHFTITILNIIQER